jgi:GNAT superfamily N-acetyltransferase
MKFTKFLNRLFHKEKFHKEKFEILMYDTSPEHAEKYGFKCVKPLFVNSINIDKSQRLKGLGSKALKHVEKYALNNGFDIIFGHIPFEAEFTKDDRQTTFTDREMIKYWLHSKGYAVNPENFDFHKVIQKKK